MSNGSPLGFSRPSEHIFLEYNRFSNSGIPISYIIIINKCPLRGLQKMVVKRVYHAHILAGRHHRASERI